MGKATFASETFQNSTWAPVTFQSGGGPPLLPRGAIILFEINFTWKVVYSEDFNPVQEVSEQEVSIP